MTATAPRTNSKLSRFVAEALAAPQQAREVQLKPMDKPSDNANRTHGPKPTHAHGDFGHADR